jgi:hypothetical protein
VPTESQYAKMIAENRQFAVVTRVTPVREGGRILVHTYGPYDRRKAQNVSQRMKRDAVREGYADRIEISVCTLLDSDGEMA